MFNPSKQQVEIFNQVSGLNPGQNLFVSARAGTGKTTTAVKALEYIPNNKSVLFCAFNKSIATELEARVQPFANCKASTYHAFGLSGIRKSIGKFKIEANTNLYRLQNKYTQDFKPFFSKANNLTSKVKNTLAELDDFSLTELAYLYDIDVNGDSKIIFDMTRYLIESCKSMTPGMQIDFDDMIYLPVACNLPVDKYDVIISDESQDLNLSQIRLLQMARNKNTNSLFVGDIFQSIYSFRGADSNAVNRIIAENNCTVLPLSVTYRCGKAIVANCNDRFPEIDYSAHENNPEGNILHAKDTELYNLVNDGDMILCRTNAPLVKNCLEFIRAGRKAVIRGRDIAKNLQSLIKKFDSDNISMFLQKLESYRVREIDKLEKLNLDGMLQALNDKVDTLIALSDGCGTTYELSNRLDTIFSDDNNGIVFSSVHKAKGLESSNVLILKPELMPHPMAAKSKNPESAQQEKNIEYVAITRAKNQLTYLETTKG